MAAEKETVASLLLPKSEVAYLQIGDTLRQAAEKMEYHGYSVIPLLDEEGHYLYSLAQGDILSYLKKNEVGWADLGKVPLTAVPPSRPYQKGKIDDEVPSLYPLALNQNYIPIVDDRGVFVGIVTRKRLLASLLEGK